MKRINLFMLVMCSALLLAVSGCSNGGYGNKTSAPAASSGTAETGSVTILAPKDGAVLASGTGIKLTYKVHLSPNGNHLHIYVDNNSPIIDRDVSGCPCSITLPNLTAGAHQVAVKEATVIHHLTGVQSTVKFTVK